jgi:hypothetical protein
MNDNDPVARLTNEAVNCGVPFIGAQTLAHYIVNKIPTGGFLESFLANDLMGALNSADSTNINLFHKHQPVPSLWKIPVQLCAACMSWQL